MSGENNNFAIAGAGFGILVGGSPVLTETLGQVELLRHTKQKKPLLKGDTFESLQKNMDKESFEYVSKNKKFFMSPIFKKFGILAFFIAGGMFLGNMVKTPKNKD